VGIRESLRPGYCAVVLNKEWGVFVRKVSGNCQHTSRMCRCGTLILGRILAPESLWFRSLRIGFHRRIINDPFWHSCLPRAF